MHRNRNWMTMLFLSSDTNIYLFWNMKYSVYRNLIFILYYFCARYEVHTIVILIFLIT